MNQSFGSSDHGTEPGDTRTDPRIARDAYERVRDAWREGCRRRDPTYAPLRLALADLARQGRGAAVPIAELLKSLDTMLDQRAGGESSLDWDDVRRWAGGVVIHAYYRDD